jgi:hypothetical protein
MAHDSSAAFALSDLANVGFSFYALSVCAWLCVATVAIAGTRLVWRWLAGFTSVTAVLCIVGSTGAIGRSGQAAAGTVTTTAWYLAFLLTFALTNLCLLVTRRGRERSQGDTS